MTIKELLAMPDGANWKGELSIVVENAYEKKTGTSNKGPWDLQNCTIRDNSAEGKRLVVWHCSTVDFRDQIGNTIVLEGTWKVEDNEYKGNITRQLSISKPTFTGQAPVGDTHAKKVIEALGGKVVSTTNASLSAELGKVWNEVCNAFPDKSQDFKELAFKGLLDGGYCNGK